MEIKQLTNEEFNSFKNSFQIGSIYQTAEYGFVMNHQGFDSVILGLVDDENHIIGAGLILIKKVRNIKYAYAPRGFLIDYTNYSLIETFTDLLKKYLSKLGIVTIRINPLIIKSIYDKKHDVLSKNEYYDIIYNNLIKLGYKHLGYNSYFEGLKPRFEAIIEIDKPYYLIFNDLNKGFKTKIRSASKNGIKIYTGDNLEYLYLQTKKKYPRNLEYFKDCYKYFSKNKNIEFYYAKLDTKEYLKVKNKELLEQEKKVNYYNENIAKSNNINLKIEADKKYNHLKKQLIEATNLLKNNPDGIVTASTLIIKNKDEVYLFMDGYDVNYKSLNSKHLLLWKLIENYSNQNYKKFNLGGMTNPFEKNNSYEGLNNFKLGFNSKVYEYIGDLELVCNNTKYFFIKNSVFKNTLKSKSI